MADTGFLPAWQGYFTALDDLAEAIIAEHEAQKAYREHCRLGMFFNVGDPEIAERHRLYYAHADSEVLREQATAAFTRAYLTLKPYLPAEGASATPTEDDK